MKGKITSPGSYSDNSPRFEIAIYDNSIPHSYHQRINYSLRINDQVFICGVNSSEQSGLWVGPDLYDKITNEKWRLSEILISNGFSQNEEISVEYSKEMNELIVTSLGLGSNTGNIRSKALKWYKEKYGKLDSPIYASKLYSVEESWTKDYVWFVQVPVSTVENADTEFINILCQDVLGSDDFFHLKVPSQYIWENIDSFDRIKNHIAIYLSPRAENYMRELRGKGKVSFKPFLTNS
jgi:hypothetical protein